MHSNKKKDKKVDRRSFLQTAGVVAGSAFASSDDVRLLDPRKPPSPSPTKGKKIKQARKGQATRATARRDQRFRDLFEKVAPRAGFEPATLRLTAGCSTVELPRNEAGDTPPARIGTPAEND